MRRALAFIAIIGISTIVLSFCSCLLNALILKARNAPGCPPLPEGFSEAELVGTWMAGWSGHTDTLEIKADGTYKQIVRVEFVDQSPIDYESGWQSWRLEYSEDYIGYLHLDGFRFCGMNPDIPCEERIGDGYDFCRDESIKMDNECILLVLTTRGKESQVREVPLYDIHLAYPLGSENSWSYFLQ